MNTPDQDKRLPESRNTRQLRFAAKHFCPTAFCHSWRSNGETGKVVYGINSEHDLDQGEWLSFGIATAKEAWRLALEKLEATQDLGDRPRRQIALGYEVNDIGEVFSYWVQKGNGPRGGATTVLGSRARKLKPGRVSAGYYSVVMHHDGKPRRVKIHRLVLEAFVGTCPEGMECCHDNGIRTDNRLANLRWDTPKANSADKFKHGTNSQKLTKWQVAEIRQRLDSGETAKDLAGEYGVNPGTIYVIRNKKTWAYAGGIS